MFSEAKVTEIYCIADNFCKEFAKYQKNHTFPNSPKNGKHFFEKKPAIEMEFINDGQLTLFLNYIELTLY